MAWLLPAALVAAGAEAADIRVEGVVSDTAATVSVNGRAAAVQPDGRYSVGVPLADGPATITATATNRLGEQASRTVQVTIDSQPPGRQAGSPTGTLPSTTTQTTLSLTTNEPAVCRRASMANTPYSAMTLSFTASADGRTHQALLTGLQAGGTLTTYVRCADQAQNANADDYVISFSIAAASPPVRSNGAPTGTLPAGTTQTTLSLSTNEPATCQYGTTPNQPYGAFTTPFATTGGTTHSSSLTGLAGGQSYTYYVRCKDADNQVNTDDYAISFSVTQGDPPDPNNLLLNPGFESGTTAPTHWTTQSWQASQGSTTCQFSLDAVNPHSGTRSAKIHCPAGGLPDDASWVQAVAVTPNTDYILSGWIRVQDVEPQQFVFANDVGANISSPNLANAFPSTTWGTTGSLWVQRRLRFNTGSLSSLNIAARLGYFASLTTGTAWFDDLRLERAMTPVGTLNLTQFAVTPPGTVDLGTFVDFTYSVSGTTTGWLTFIIDCDATSYSADALWITSELSGTIPNACQYTTAGARQVVAYLERDTVRTSRSTTVTAGSGGTNQAPVVSINGAATRTVTKDQSFTLTSTVTDDGRPNPPGALVFSWSDDDVFSPPSVEFATPGSKDTSVTIRRTGTYVLTLSAFDGERAGYDAVTVTVTSSSGTNQAPTVNVGLDAAVTLPNTLALNPTVSDDGKPNPPAALTYNWTKESGPGTVTFSPNATTKNVTASFSASGTYVLKLTVSDSALSASDTLTVTVQGSGVTIPPCTFTGPTSVQVEERFGVGWNCPAPATVVHSSGWGAPGSDPTPSGGTAPIAPDVRPFVGEGDFTGGPGLSSGWGSFMRLSEPGVAQVTLTPRDAAGN
ncbi:MAG: hypothetical protein COV75_01950, partial [Candidatus Omnitrophica bacterium CG11_big_fil_rev_8_21_14_0_20_63_9]